MANASYVDQLNAEQTEKIRAMLRTLPTACSDFINSIAMTTSVLTRMAYTIDLQTFCGYATKELPYFSDKLPENWTDLDLSHFTARDLNGYADYLTLYYKESDIGETVEQQKILRNHECGVMRKLSSLRSFFDYLLYYFFPNFVSIYLKPNVSAVMLQHLCRSLSCMKNLFSIWLVLKLNVY